MRKLHGFISYNALYGCSKCWRGPGSVYPAACRTHAQAEKAARHYKVHVNSAFRDREFTKVHFARWCPLYELSYFDVIRCHVVDPMHNLFLGIVLRHLGLLFTQVLTDGQKKELDRRVAMMNEGFPSRFLGRLPTNLTQFYNSMRAEQLLNFLLFYSEVAFFSLLPAPHYALWKKLVHACRLFCSPILKDGMADEAHGSYIAYLETYITIFGEENVVPNHHMACHLRDILLDFGPVFSYWCFPFERLNGCLQGFPNNGVNIEGKILHRCLVGFLTCHSLVNASFVAALRIPRVFLDLMRLTTQKRQTPTFRLRQTSLPLPNSKVTGCEPFDGRVVGSRKFTFLNTRDFEALSSFFQVKISNGADVSARFSVGSTVLISELYKKTVPTPFSITTPQWGDPIRSGSLLLGVEARQTGPPLGVCQLVGPLCHKDLFHDPETSPGQ